MDAARSGKKAPDMDSLISLLEQHKTSISEEFKAAFSGLNIRLGEMDSKIEGHGLRLDNLETAAGKTSDDMTAMEADIVALKSENVKIKAKLADLEGRSRRNNIRIFGLPESIEGPRPTVFFSQLLMDVLGEETLDSPPELDRAHRVMSSKPAEEGEKPRPRAVIIRFHRFQTKELVIRATRKMRGKLQYNNKPIFIYEDYSPEVMEMRADYREVMKDLYNAGLKPSLYYPAKLFITLEDGVKTRLSSQREATEYLAKHQRSTRTESPPEHR